MPLVEQHVGSRPESCPVCRYLQLHPLLDRLMAHTLTMLAGWTLLEDLQSANGSLSMHSVYLETFAGDSDGRAIQLEPEHYLLALLAAPEIKLTIETTTEEQA